MRGLARLREAGVLDGMWTAAASAGGKIQALVLLGAAGTLGGIEATGLVVLVTSTGILVMALLDAGLTPQIGRLAAQGEVASRDAIRGPLARRVLLHVPSGVAAYLLVVHLGLRPDEAAVWCAAQVAYGIGFHLAYSTTGLAYGQFRFRPTAVLNASIRLATVPALLAVAAWDAPLYLLVFVLAAGELVIAGVQYAKARTKVDAPITRAALTVRNTWRYGVGAIANTVMNKSDTVVLAAALSATGLGTYAIASQTENALTTLALIPAGALIVHVARSGHGDESQAKFATTARVVAAVYAVMALPVLVAPAPIAHLVFRVTVDDTTPLRICVASGLLFVIASVQMQHLTGLGAARDFTRIWVVTAVVGIAAMVVLANAWGATGAAIGAVVRDATYFALTLAAVRRWHPRGFAP